MRTHKFIPTHFSHKGLVQVRDPTSHSLDEMYSYSLIGKSRKIRYARSTYL